MERNRCSGSSGRADLCSSDTTSDAFYVEHKYRSTHPLWTAWLEFRDQEAKRTRRPIALTLTELGKPGHLVLCHVDHVESFIKARSTALRRDGVYMFAHKECALHHLIRKRFGAWTAWREAVEIEAKQAERDGRKPRPVALNFSLKNHRGRLVVVHVRDVKAYAAELAQAKKGGKV